MNLREKLGRERLFFDGGTGTLLHAQGLKGGELPETWNLLHPERIHALQNFCSGAVHFSPALWKFPPLPSIRFCAPMADAAALSVFTPRIKNFSAHTFLKSGAY